MADKLLAACSDLGYANSFVDTFPDYLKTLGIEKMFADLNIQYEDLGKVEAPHINKQKFSNPSCKFASTIAEYSKKVADVIESNVDFAKDTLVTIGGDHSIAIGTISGILRKQKKTGVLWIDAHPDANTPDTTLTGWVYGMCTAALCGLGDEKLLAINNKNIPHADPEHFAIYGAQYIDPGEYVNTKKLGIHLTTMEDIIEQGLQQTLDTAVAKVTEGTELLHVSLDLDAIDELYAPGTSECSKGQFSYREIKYICRKIGKTKKVSSIDIVEGDPSKDINGKTGKLAIELLADLLGYEYSDYSSYISLNSK